jgi:hypothetical protein
VVLRVTATVGPEQQNRGREGAGLCGFPSAQRFRGREPAKRHGEEPGESAWPTKTFNIVSLFPKPDPLSGRSLLHLLLAFASPAIVLYARIVLAIAASRAGVTRREYAGLIDASYAALVIFFLLELFAARYVQRLLRPARTRLGGAVQYVGTFITCVLCSVSGAIALEAFGYNLFVRVLEARR